MSKLGQDQKSADSPRRAVMRLLWEKEFERSPYSDKFDIVRPSSLESNYGALADKIIAVVRGSI